MDIVLLFPGQGSQKPGRAKDLVDAQPAARELFGSVDRALGVPLSALCFDGPADVDARSRARFRLRLQLTDKIDNHFDWGLRLASGSFDDPTSSNQTLTSFYDRKPFAVDRAYIHFTTDTKPANLDVYVDKALKNGGTIALPKMPIPTVGWLAYCKDTEGNIFGMMQMDPNAK